MPNRRTRHVPARPLGSRILELLESKPEGPVSGHSL